MLRPEARVGLAMLGGEPLQRRAEIGIAEARGMQHQHAGRDVALRRPKPEPARLVETLEHLKLADLRNIALRRRVEVETALLHALQDRGPGDRLGAGKEREDAIGRHRLGLAEAPHAGRALIKSPLPSRRHRDDAGNARLAGYRLLHDRVGGGGEFSGHRSSLERRASH